MMSITVEQVSLSLPADRWGRAGSVYAVAGCDSTTPFIQAKAVMHGFFEKSRAQLRGQRGFTLIAPGTIPVRAGGWRLWFFWLGGLLAALLLGRADRRRDARVSAAPAPTMP